ncbi:MAG: Hsp20/alpha crystallin family protein [Candidatus Omnitrophica bacterium]|nr:Hsp20/alpha crystallin family protein [Candidatus Omnitrophota bacterium]
MRRLLIIFAVFVLGSGSWAALASQEEEASAAALERAKQDYRVYLAQLKSASRQYQEVTGEMKKVIQEEGVPVFDEETGELTVQHALDLPDPAAVEETDKEMLVSLELPGLNKESLQVKIKNRKTLFVTAERRGQKKDEPAEKISRTVELPAPASAQGTRADYRDGILQITLPKESPSESSIPVD